VSFAVFHRSAFLLRSELCNSNGPSFQFQEKQHTGIPFKTIPEYLKGEIVRKTHAALKPKGEFLVYQLSGAVRPYLERVFGAVRHDFELLSIPPGRMFYCER